MDVCVGNRLCFLVRVMNVINCIRSNGVCVVCLRWSHIAKAREDARANDIRKWYFCYFIVALIGRLRFFPICRLLFFPHRRTAILLFFFSITLSFVLLVSLFASFSLWYSCCLFASLMVTLQARINTQYPLHSRNVEGNKMRRKEK